MHPRRITAAVATGVLMTAGAVVLAAPGAQAAEVAYTSACTNDFLGPVGESATKVDISVSPVKDKYTVGEQVTISWKWLQYNNVPANSPLPTIPANSTKPFGDLGLTGAQTGIVSVEGPQEHPAANAGEPLKVADMSGTLTLTAPGTLDLTPKAYKTVTDISGIKSATSCVPAPGQVPGIGATLVVEGQGTQDPVLNGPAESHAGFEIDLTGSNFAPNATPQLSLCAVDGTGCDAAKFTSNTLAIDAQGKLAGKAKLATVVANGPYSIKVSDGVKSASYAFTVTPYVVPGERAATAAPNVGGVGDTVTVSGTNWTPNTNVNIVPMTAGGVLAGDVVSAATSPTGSFSAQVTITNAETTQIRVREGISSTKRVFVPFTVRTIAPLDQDLKVALAPGSLSMTQAGDGIDFGSITLNGEAQTAKANLNQVTVVDARGGNLGWSLTGTMTDLVAANGTDKIPAGNLSWSPSCAALPGSPSQVANGTPGALGTAPATLCSSAATGGTTGGKFTADAEISLTTPQFAAAGAYTGTLTLTLI